MYVLVLVLGLYLSPLPFPLFRLLENLLYCMMHLRQECLWDLGFTGGRVWRGSQTLSKPPGFTKPSSGTPAALLFVPLLSHLAPHSCQHPHPSLAHISPLVTRRFMSLTDLREHLCFLRHGWPLPPESLPCPATFSELGGEGETDDAKNL